MKKFIVLLSLVSVATFTFAFDQEKSIVVQGGAKKYTKTSYSITEKFGEYFRIPQAKYVHIFNEKGQELETTEFTAKDVLVDKITYQYNAQNQLETATYSGADGSVGWKVMTTYKDDKKVEDAEFDKDGALSGKTIYHYKDNTTEEAYYNGEGNLLWKNITENDATGKEIKSYQYLSTGRLDTTKVPTYNDEGKLSGYQKFNMAGALIEKVVYRNNVEGLLAEALTYDKDDTLTARKLWKYDDKKNPVRITTYNVSQKFGSTVNELTSIAEYVYEN